MLRSTNLYLPKTIPDIKFPIDMYVPIFALQRFDVSKLNKKTRNEVKAILYKQKSLSN